MKEIITHEVPEVEDGNPRKKFKRNDDDVQIETDKSLKVKPERCNICRQYNNEVLIYNGHPNNSVEEYITLTDERLLLFTGNEESLNQHDERPTHKITYYSVYDKNGHLCPFDTGLIEANKLLYFSGYVKPIYDEDSSTNNGLPTKDMGPINEWYITGFDGGEKALVGFSTAYAEYFLQEPSLEYQPIMNSVAKKFYLAKLMIEFLLDEGWQNPTYEDLLQRLEATGDPELTEETLLRHAQFICDQVTSFDSSAKDDEPLLITAPCMRALVKMAGVTFQKRQRMHKLGTKGIKKSTAIKWSKAATTNLVREVFENFFIDQIDNKEKDDKGPRRKRCGVCEPCQTPDCGKCNHCRDMLKFGGTGRSKQACQMRRCPYMEIQNADEESDSDEDQSGTENTGENKLLPCSKRIIHKTEWIGEPILSCDDRIYYHSAKVGDIIIEPGDYVILNSAIPNKPLLIAQAIYLFEEAGAAMFHAHQYCRGTDTVLGETADPRELFMVDICEKCPLGSIVRKTQVFYRKLSKNWAQNGGLDKLPPQLEDGETFFYTKHYNADHSRFEDCVEPDSDLNDSSTPCVSCLAKSRNSKLTEPRISEGTIRWHDEIYRIGSAVFVDADVFRYRPIPDIKKYMEEKDVDIEIYPEYYRKPIDNQKGSNEETSHSFGIGLIEDIKELSGKKDNIGIKIRRFYRPEHTKNGDFVSFEEDLNVLYWSDEIYNVRFSKVKGKCYVAYGDGLEIPAREWSEKGPYRFYFTKAYNDDIQDYLEVPVEATKIGIVGKGKGKGKGKSNKSETGHDAPPLWPQIDGPLKCMDVFAGCGGLSEGLHQSGVAVTKWAIEKEPAAAYAFKLNNSDAIVYTDDCNELLQSVISGNAKNGKTLPKKGEVEMLVGGPPCQGFSGMNRFNAGQYSLFKNSLIVSYLSYCDYYRPHYFILENVRNFVSFKRSMVLKLTLRCLLAIGYQVTFGVVQAGNYGIPQTRRRLIIMAAAPGYALPRYPEPQHVFNKKACQLTIPVDNHKYTTGVLWQYSAPYRTITVRDSMSDLPSIKNGCNVKEMQYDDEPISHFQRMMRGNDTTNIVKDHICKEMAPLVEGRMSQIPVCPGADWRDLPNIVMRLSDGTYANKLKYPHRSKKQKKTDPPRGVCLCATGKSCEPADRQFNTLIPWCLPHTADRHNNWSGLYGRLDWDGFFSTTVTNPEPMGKQGRVLHPEQHRVVSVRECARSQGFPDRYQFYGNILDKHRQVGNAVPPPLGAAIGKEIKKALVLTMESKKS